MASYHGRCVIDTPVSIVVRSGRLDRDIPIQYSKAGESSYVATTSDVIAPTSDVIALRTMTWVVVVSVERDIYKHFGCYHG